MLQATQRHSCDQTRRLQVKRMKTKRNLYREWRKCVFLWLFWTMKCDEDTLMWLIRRFSYRRIIVFSRFGGNVAYSVIIAIRQHAIRHFITLQFEWNDNTKCRKKMQMIFNISSRSWSGKIVVQTKENSLFRHLPSLSFSHVVQKSLMKQIILCKWHRERTTDTHTPCLY